LFKKARKITIYYAGMQVPQIINVKI